MASSLDPDWVKEIRRCAANLRASEETLTNQEVHAWICSTWANGSPAMMAQLEVANLVDDLALVLQERMWNRQAELLKAGFSVTDAREQAEREELMLDPEASET